MEKQQQKEKLEKEKQEKLFQQQQQQKEKLEKEKQQEQEIIGSSEDNFLTQKTETKQYNQIKKKYFNSLGMQNGNASQSSQNTISTSTPSRLRNNTAPPKLSPDSVEEDEKQIDSTSIIATSLPPTTSLLRISPNFDNKTQSLLTKQINASNNNNNISPIDMPNSNSPINDIPFFPNLTDSPTKKRSKSTPIPIVNPVAIGIPIEQGFFPQPRNKLDSDDDGNEDYDEIGSFEAYFSKKDNKFQVGTADTQTQKLKWNQKKNEL